jgi:hypothetical protein
MCKAGVLICGELRSRRRPPWRYDVLYQLRQGCRSSEMEGENQSSLCVMHHNTRRCSNVRSYSMDCSLVPMRYSSQIKVFYSRGQVHISYNIPKVLQAPPQHMASDLVPGSSAHLDNTVHPFRYEITNQAEHDQPPGYAPKPIQVSNLLPGTRPVYVSQRFP